MKNVGRVIMVFLLLVVSCLLLVNYGCQSLSSVDSGGEGVGTSAGLFYTSTSGATPVFLPGSGSASGVAAMSAEWQSGTPLYSVYYTLREFVSPRDEGVVDRSNLYKLLIDVDSVYSGVSTSAQSITEQAITPPFAQLPSVTCNKAINNESSQKAVALKETTEEVDAIITWVWTEEANPLKAEYGIATIDYDKLTKDITVEMTFSVDYDTDTTATGYNLRCQVSGNRDENAFQFKYIIGDQKIVAKGVSSGEANHMLFKYSSGDTVNYIVVSAEASEDFFIAQNTSPTQIYTDPTSLPATVADYKDWVVATDFFSSEALVTDISTLNSGNAKEGTIYLSYE